MRALIEKNMIPDDVTVQVLTQAREHIIRKTFEAVKGAPHAVIHLYNSTSVAQREQVFHKDKEEIKKQIDANMNSRKSKQPIDKPSAGSTFKRPKDNFAAKLIDDAGLKGYSIGGAEVSSLHAGFVVNKGNATSKDIVKLIKYIQEKVSTEFGVMLEPEVRIIGEEKEDE